MEILPENADCPPRSWDANFIETDGEPIRKAVGRPPAGDILTQLDQLNRSLKELTDRRGLPHDGDHVRKSVGKVD